MQNTVIRCLPPVLVIQHPSSDQFVFPEAAILANEEWRTMDVEMFYVPQGSFSETQVIASGTLGAAVSVSDVSSTAIAELRAVVGAIKGARSLPEFPGLDDLLTLALESRGAPRDVEEWARQLSEDVGTLID